MPFNDRYHVRNLGSSIDMICQSIVNGRAPPTQCLRPGPMVGKRCISLPSIPSIGPCLLQGPGRKAAEAGRRVVGEVSLVTTPKHPKPP